MTKVISVTFVNLIRPKAGAKHELLFHQPDSHTTDMITLLMIVALLFMLTVANKPLMLNVVKFGQLALFHQLLEDKV